MVQKQYDYLVFIGRFQPLHLGHIEVINRARTMADKVIVLIGSAFQPRTPKNPFTHQERTLMIQNTFPNSESWLSIRPLRDKPYSDQKWATQVQQLVASCLPWSDKPPRGGIIGHRKDDSSFYLDMFPQWGDPIDHDINEVVHATDIRELFFESSIKFLDGVVSQPVRAFLEKFKSTPAYQGLLTEHQVIKKYREAWKASPYPPIFVTTDAVVIQSGHVLLVRRKFAPGVGTLALPGGFLSPTETIITGIVRELREETKIRIPAPVLRGSITRMHCFDAPYRSLRGRTLTHAALIELPAGPLPAVRGADDAASAGWVLLSAVREEEMFEDHYGIIDFFLGTS